MIMTEHRALIVSLWMSSCQGPYNGCLESGTNGCKIHLWHSMVSILKTRKIITLVITDIYVQYFEYYANVRIMFTTLNVNDLEMLPASDKNKGRSVESNHRTEHWDVVDDNLFGGEMIRRRFERVENFVEIISVQIIFLENRSHLGLDGVSIDEKEVENIFCIPSHNVSTRVVIEIAVLHGSI